MMLTAVLCNVNTQPIIALNVKIIPVSANVLMHPPRPALSDSPLKEEGSELEFSNTQSKVTLRRLLCAERLGFVRGRGSTSPSLMQLARSIESQNGVGTALMYTTGLYLSFTLPTLISSFRHKTKAALADKHCRRHGWQQGPLRHSALAVFLMPGGENLPC